MVFEHGYRGRRIDAGIDKISQSDPLRVGGLTCMLKGCH